MTPKEAEEKYGKEIVYKIWNTEWLKNVNCIETPDGIDISEGDWESAYLNINETFK